MITHEWAAYSVTYKQVANKFTHRWAGTHKQVSYKVTRKWAAYGFTHEQAVITQKQARKID
jgi:hypothetical protein